MDRRAHPGGPTERSVSVADRVGAALLLPAQGGWLALALAYGGAWWAAWATLLAALVAVVLWTFATATRSARAPRSLLLVTVLVFMLGWVVAAVVVESGP